MNTLNKVMISSVICLVSIQGFCQIQWIGDYDQAVKTAQVRGKLIVLDFWASWCGPCLEMDKKVWSHEDLGKLKDDFIFVKINVDRDRAFSQKMMVKVLPTLIVMDIDQNRLHESKGYADVYQVLHYFEDLPNDVSFIYNRMEEASSDDKNWKAVLDIALAYNDFAGKAENGSAKRSLYTASSHYFKKAGKVAKGNEADQEIVDIYETLSKAQRTSPEKAIKDLDKLYANSSGSNEDLFNYAYCCGFMLQGDLSKADSYYNKLTTSEGTEDLISKIDVLKETSGDH